MCSSLQRHAGLNEKQMCRWMAEERRAIRGVLYLKQEEAVGGGAGCWRGKQSVRSVMQTSEPKVQQAAKTARQMPLEIQCDTSTGPTLAS